MTDDPTSRRRVVVYWNPWQATQCLGTWRHNAAINLYSGKGHQIRRNILSFKYGCPSSIDCRASFKEMVQIQT